VFVGYCYDDRLPHHAVLAPTMACEKRPDCLPPTRAAPFSLATLLALASSESGSTVVCMLKVLATIFSLPYSCELLVRMLQR
jgi:hypothetical protein